MAIFNPNEHLIELKSKSGSQSYLPVQWRLVWFREQCPNGAIDTEELEVDTEKEVEEEVFVWNNATRKSEKVIKHAKGYARYRAVITDGKGGRATGTKCENAASFPDYVEKAETGAIGRALAALGYGTQFAPDLDEAHRIVDSPVEHKSATPSSIDKMKSDWALVYKVSDTEIEERWTKYKVFVFGGNIDDPDLSVAQLARINGNIEAQRRKAPAAKAS